MGGFGDVTDSFLINAGGGACNDVGDGGNNNGVGVGGSTEAEEEEEEEDVVVVVVVDDEGRGRRSEAVHDVCGDSH
jgi:hypothetical protein